MDQLMTMRLTRIRHTHAFRHSSLRPDTQSYAHGAGRDELLAATAHELRLPLSHIKGFVSTLRQSDVTWDEETRAEFLAEIETETDRLAQMLDSLLDTRRGSLTPARVGNTHPVSPSVVIEGGLHRVRGLVGQRVIRCHMPADLPEFWMDANAIERVLANLLQNAVKYSPTACPIDISAHIGPAGELELRVEDRGPGVPGHIRERIFEPFYRNRTHLESKAPGQGLGLAICQHIVKEHDGHIEVSERPGGGARFSVFLPARPIAQLPALYQRED